MDVRILDFMDFKRMNSFSAYDLAKKVREVLNS